MSETYRPEIVSRPKRDYSWLNICELNARDVGQKVEEESLRVENKVTAQRFLGVTFEES